MNLPEIPQCKKWQGKTTPEQDVLFKIQMGKPITQSEVEILNCAYEFYVSAFESLKIVNFNDLSEDDLQILKKYLFDVINMELTFQNKITVRTAYRMIWVENYNLEDGKVRDPKFLSHTPLDIVKSIGKFGRANTTESTCLYLAETPQVAVFECKPSPGSRIIIAGWTTKKNEPLIMYPINTSSRVNLGVTKATDALDKILQNSNEYYSRVIKIIEEFIGSEFIKDVPIISKNRYEYLFSAYFADKIMNSQLYIEDNNNSPILGQYDGIIYPSIATKYNYDNIAVRETSIHKLKPLFCHEYFVEKTGYNDFDGTDVHLPFIGREIRSSTNIGARIQWDDD